MAGEVIDEAYVEIRPQVDPAFGRNVEQGVSRALGRVGSIVDRALAPVQRSFSTAFERGGSRAESAVSGAVSGISSDLNSVRSDADRAGVSIGEGISDGADDAEESIGGLGKAMDNLKKVGVAAGAAIGVALAANIGGALDLAGARGQLKAQLGLSEKDAANVGRIAGSLYSHNFGESLDEVKAAIGRVTQNLDIAANSPALERITSKALTLSQVFDVDVADSTRAVGSLLRNNLAKNATQAFDIFTRGLQNGANKADDLADTFNEYGPLFSRLGLDGSQALGLISQGLQAGARDSDTVADAIKEFQIRATDASVTSAAGFDALGLSAEKMTAQIAGGGKGAADGLNLVLERLRGIEDPVKRNAAAVALFGTKAEDLGASLFALDPSKAVKSLGKVGGAAAKAGNDFNNTAGAKLEAFKRKITVAIQQTIADKIIPAVVSFGESIAPVVDKLITAGDAAGKFASAVAKALEPVTDFLTKTQAGQAVLAGIVTVIGLAVAAFTALKVAQAVSAIATGAWTVVTTIATGVTSAWAGATIALDAALAVLTSPITLVIVGIIALVAAVIFAIKHFDKIKEVVGKAMSFALDAVSSFASKIPGLLGKVIAFFATLPIKIPIFFLKLQLKITSIMLSLGVKLGTIILKMIVRAALFFASLPERVVNAVRSLPGKMVAFAFAVQKALSEGLRNLVNRAVEIVTTMPDRISNLAGKMLSAGKSLMGALIKGIGSAAGTIGDIAKTIGNALIGFINDHVIDPINGALEFSIKIGPKTFTVNPPDIPHIPGFARGAVVDSATLGVFGEAGREALVPLSSSRAGDAARVIAQSGILDRRDIMSKIPGSGSGGDTHVQINQNFYGPTTSGGRLREIDWTMRYATRARAAKTEGVAT